MVESEDGDQADVRLAQSGDREAFGRIYDRHAKSVRAVVAAVTTDWEAVEDLTQETFVRAYRGFANLRDHRRLGAWLRGIARLTSREWCRQARRETPLCEELLDAPDDVADRERQSLVRSALSALALLPENERQVIHSYFFHDQSKSQAARALGMSRSGYYQVLQRALKRLRSKFPLEPTNGSQRHE